MSSASASLPVSAKKSAIKPQTNYIETVTLEEIKKAAVRISPYVNRTPFVSKSSLSRDAGFQHLFWKCEALQRVGSFKLRSATSFIVDFAERHQESASSQALHFVTHSSGNFGQAVAKAAKFVNAIAHIVVPQSAAQSKIRAMKAMGAEVVIVKENTTVARENAALALQKSIPNAIYIHPHEDDTIVAACGTVGLELVEQFSNLMISLEKRRRQHEEQEQRKVETAMNIIPREVPLPNFIAPDVVIIPSGGGPLLAASAVVIRKKCGPKTLIIGAEAVFAPDAASVFHTGKVDPKQLDKQNKSLRVHRQRPGKTVADGLVTHLSQPLLDLIKANVDDIFTVTEQEIARATVLIFERLKIVIEPAAALAAAVAIFYRTKIALKFPENPCDTCVVVLSEGNIDVARMSELAKL